MPQAPKPATMVDAKEKEVGRVSMQTFDGAEEGDGRNESKRATTLWTSAQSGVGWKDSFHKITFSPGLFSQIRKRESPPKCFWRKIAKKNQQYYINAETHLLKTFVGIINCCHCLSSMIGERPAAAGGVVFPRRFLSAFSISGAYSGVKKGDRWKGCGSTWPEPTARRPATPGKCCLPGAPTDGSPGMSISPSCVVSSHPSGAFFNWIRFLVGRTFFNGVPGIQIVVVHPESKQSCVSLVWSNSRVPNSCGLIVPCFSYSLNCCPNLVGLHFFLYNFSSRLSIVCCTESVCIIAFHALVCVGMLFHVGVIMFFICIVFIYSLGLIPLSACFKCIRFSIFLLEILSSVGIFLVFPTLVVEITPMISSVG